MSNWQGGIRVNAYAAGGLLPAAVRGTKSEGLFAGCDIYTTFCAIAGVDPTDERAAAAGLPPVDGVNQWPFLSGATTVAPRTEIAVGSDATEANLLQISNRTVVQGLVRADGYFGYSVLSRLTQPENFTMLTFRCIIILGHYLVTTKDLCLHLTPPSLDPPCRRHPRTRPLLHLRRRLQRQLDRQLRLRRRHPCH